MHLHAPYITLLVPDGVPYYENHGLQCSLYGEGVGWWEHYDHVTRGSSRYAWAGRPDDGYLRCYYLNKLHLENQCFGMGFIGSGPRTRGWRKDH